MPRFSSFRLAACLLACIATLAHADAPDRRKAADLIRKQDPPTISPRLLDKLTPENTSLIVSLLKQRAYLMAGEEVVVDTPISSGKRAGMTPSGSFKVLEKDANHRSSVYGDYVNSRGAVVRRGVSTHIDSAPSGTHYVGAPMRWFMRLTNEGVGMHTGILPGYPASHGCIRLPDEIAALFYQKCRVGTPVKVGD